MTRLFLAAGLALLLAACGGNDADTANDAVADAGLEQEDVITNDITAIDAATADDSGMAADLAPPTGNEFDNGSDGSSTVRASSRRRAPTPSGSSASEESEPPQSEPAEPEPVADNAA